MRTVLLTLALSFFASCKFTERADFARLRKETGLQLSMEDMPPGAEAIGAVYGDDSGLYLLGHLPLRRVSMERTLERMSKHAKSLDADGLSSIRIGYNPAYFFTFEIPYFPWISYLEISAMAWRMAPQPEP